MSRPGKRRKSQPQAQRHEQGQASAHAHARECDRGQGMPPIHFRPANPEQARAAEAFGSCDILVLLGCAGTGKTHLALALAAQHVLSGKADRVVICRPAVTAGEKHGYLKGGVEAKMLPYLLPLHDCLRGMTLAKPSEWIKSHCEIAPLAYMRGRTFSGCVAILDEAQNATLPQLKLFATRIGHKGKLVLSGDHTQEDIPDSGLLEFCERMVNPDLPGVRVCRLDGEVNPRHPLIPELLRRLA